jgi:hypothetical protein
MNYEYVIGGRRCVTTVVTEVAVKLVAKLGFTYQI